MLHIFFLLNKRKDVIRQMIAILGIQKLQKERGFVTIDDMAIEWYTFH